LAVLSEPPWTPGDRPTATPAATEFFDSEAALWASVGNGDDTALAELFDRHGAAAYAVANTITRDPERATQAVVAAFVQLRTDAAERVTSRPLRVEVLDASRRNAARAGVAAPLARRSRRRRPRDAYRSMPSGAREVLALAVAGRCDCTEIATILEMDRATVGREILVGLRHTAAYFGRRQPGTRRANTAGWITQ